MSPAQDLSKGVRSTDPEQQLPPPPPQPLCRTRLKLLLMQQASRHQHARVSRCSPRQCGLLQDRAETPKKDAGAHRGMEEGGNAHPPGAARVALVE